MIERTNKTIVKVINNIYGYLEELDQEERSTLFDFTINYYTHEVNSSKIPNKISISQGYLLMTTSKF